MANILFVLAPKGFRDKEYFTPHQILEENGHNLRTASTIVGDLTGADGGEASSTMHFNEVNVQEFDGVVFVGGPGMIELVGNTEMTKLVKLFFTSGKLVAAICVAVAILARADLIKDKRVAAWAGVEDEIKEAGGNFTENKVEVDQNIITASGPEAADVFANEIVNYFQNQLV